MYARISALVLAIALVVTGVAAAQGVQTGTIRGVVRDQQNLAVPGVTVTATSPALQGSRTAVTDIDGTFTIPALPPGVYQVRYELSGFATVTQASTVALGLTVEQNVTMRTAAVTETVEVVAETPAPIATPVVGINISKEEIDQLATGRDPFRISTMAPAVTEQSPNAASGQVIINGAFAFDNVFMMNGVDVNDNLFATPQNLFIEDAIQETQVLTSGISAEFGRFTGGVINAITKSGSNTFSGSWRMNISAPNWSDETPFQKSRNLTNSDTLSKVHEGTFGGPVIRDRLWFFVAGRHQAAQDQRTLLQTGIDVVKEDTNKRGEIKLTGTVANNHTIQGGYLNNPRSVTNDSGIFSFAMEPDVLVDRKFPNHYYFTSYRGVFGSALVESQYSQRRFKFDNSGGSDENLLTGSPFISTECACLYRAPYFVTADPTGRNNRQFTANTTLFWNASGRHDTKIGYEWFRSQLQGGNSQSPTNYVFNVDFVRGATGALLDANGDVQPNFIPGESYVEFFPAVRGATMNVNNNSFFVQDRWVLNPQLSLDLGVRFEQVKVVSTGDIISVNTNPRLVPRFGLSYDLRGDGASVAHVTYGQYSGRYNEAQVGGNSPVGNPNYLPLFYQGPPGSGWAFAETVGMNLANYPITAANFAGTPAVPTANVFVDEDLKTPLVHEFTLSFGNTIGNRGFGEISYVWRKTTSMVEDVIRAGDTTDVILNVSGGPSLNLGTVSNIRYENSDIPRREYQAMIFQTRYRVFNNLNAHANYTLQIRNHGNYEGEFTNLPGNTSIIGDYQEALSEERHYPFGRLQSFQRHKLRAWLIYTADAGRFGNVGLSGLWRVNSGGVFSLQQTNVPPTAIQNAITTQAGYTEGLGPRTIFFGGRGTEEFKGYGVFDSSVTYNIPVFRTLAPWLKFDVYNLFNNQKLIAWNTTISRVAAGPVDALGIPTTFTRGASFGTATGSTVSNGQVSGIPAYPRWIGATGDGGRTYRFAFGIRF
jgi:outer membrane receptor for ferrienterochelin and colicin